MLAVCAAYLLKDGKRWDMLYMGILSEEWKEMNK